jgi:hypothetical protein
MEDLEKLSGLVIRLSTSIEKLLEGCKLLSDRVDILQDRIGFIEGYLAGLKEPIIQERIQ